MGEPRFDGRILTEEAIAEQDRINAKRDVELKQGLDEASRLAAVESAKLKMDPDSGDLEDKEI